MVKALRTRDSVESLASSKHKNELLIGSTFMEGQTQFGMLKRGEWNSPSFKFRPHTK